MTERVTDEIRWAAAVSALNDLESHMRQHFGYDCTAVLQVHSDNTFVVEMNGCCVPDSGAPVFETEPMPTASDALDLAKIEIDVAIARNLGRETGDV